MFEVPPSLLFVKASDKMPAGFPSFYCLKQFDMTRQTPTSRVRNTNDKALCLALSFVLSAAFICHQIVVAEAQGNSLLELELVQVVFRHGNRTPQKPYEGDPNANDTFFPYGWDQLDSAGRQRAYDLGRYLRDFYGWFIGDEYIPGIVNITSTDLPRTKMTALSVAAGLFPPSDNQKWGPKGGVGQVWQPTTMNFLPFEEDDFMLVSETPCPAYDEEMKNFLEGPIHAAWLDTDKELVDELEKNANVKRSVHDIDTFFQTVRMEDFYHMTIPDWVKPYYPDRLTPFSIMHFKSEVYNRKMKRLYAGPVLGHFLETMERKRDGYPLKMWLYSGHDSTLTRLGYTMKVWDDFYPDFSNALIVELLRDSNGGYFVKAFFHNDTSKVPLMLNVEGCGELCPLNKFRSIVEDFIPTNRQEECYNRNGAVVIYQSSILIVLLLVKVAILLSF